MSEQTINRRDFLKLASTALLTASGILGLGGLLRYLSYQPELPAQQDFDLGPAENYPPGSRTMLSHAPAMLVHSEQGFSAISLVCPHLGCTVGTQSDGFACPCHGSRFDPQGKYLSGPARNSLRALQVKNTPDGHLHLILD